VIDGLFPVHALQVPVFHTAFETAAVTALGHQGGQGRPGKRTTVMAWAGDGGTFDIGIQALSGAAERNEDIIYACYDNEAYMNTGIQRSSATPLGTWTTTTPDERPESRPKKNIMEIMRPIASPMPPPAPRLTPKTCCASSAKPRRSGGPASSTFSRCARRDGRCPPTGLSK